MTALLHGDVYSREAQGRMLTFGVSGRLIMNTLVMYDLQTRTLWAQSLYKGVEGPLAGAGLEVNPSDPDLLVAVA